MADAPWRCSQCGTVNEPVANACRTCGRWPSLFDLESSTIDTGAGAPAVEEEEFAAQSVDVETTEPEVFAPDPTAASVPVDLPPEFEPDADEDGKEAAPKPLWQRLASLIVPIAVVVYILISALANR